MAKPDRIDPRAKTQAENRATMFAPNIAVALGRAERELWRGLAVVAEAGIRDDDGADRDLNHALSELRARWDSLDPDVQRHQSAVFHGLFMRLPKPAA